MLVYDGKIRFLGNIPTNEEQRKGTLFNYYWIMEIYKNCRIIQLYKKL